MNRRIRLYNELVEQVGVDKFDSINVINESNISDENFDIYIDNAINTVIHELMKEDIDDEFRDYSLIEYLKKLKIKDSEKTRLQKLQDVFEDIDWDIGFGPSEQIIDESKVDEYILNFKNKLEKYKIKEHFEVIHEEYGNKSFMEKLDEI